MKLTNALDFFMISRPESECNSWERIENMSQCTKIMKIIFTIEMEIIIDMSDNVVYYVYRGSSHGDKI